MDTADRHAGPPPHQQYPPSLFSAAHATAEPVAGAVGSGVGGAVDGGAGDGAFTGAAAFPWQQGQQRQWVAR